MHAISFLGGLLGIPTLFKKNKTKLEKELSLFVISFWALTIPHAIATIGSITMNSGFNNLMDFFSFLGLLAFIYKLALLSKRSFAPLLSKAFSNRFIPVSCM